MKRRGFTLIELCVSIAIIGIVATAVAALHFETRLAAAHREAQVTLHREASLAAEILTAAIRSADDVRTGDGKYTIGDRVFELDGRGLRADGRVVARYIDRLAIEPVKGAHKRWQLTLELSRFKAINRPYRATRSFWVEARR